MTTATRQMRCDRCCCEQPVSTNATFASLSSHRHPLPDGWTRDGIRILCDACRAAT